jgi:hypothetical protein
MLEKVELQVNDTRESLLKTKTQFQLLSEKYSDKIATNSEEKEALLKAIKPPPSFVLDHEFNAIPGSVINVVLGLSNGHLAVGGG